jgi:hypothetical protein
VCCGGVEVVYDGGVLTGQYGDGYGGDGEKWASRRKMSKKEGDF